ncbi:Uma2 family endonuclease [Ohtaekwangia sp.]|uniref:Uma2 family endonuclease n=1 Tax=Ohtaekwangia sp. TaxID=2066019 RepID=UPI002F92B363
MDVKTLTIDRSREWTVDDFLQLEESNTPCELINGELVMSPAPTPHHQNVLGNLYFILKKEAGRIGGAIFFSPIDLYIDRKNVFQSDLVFISAEKRSIITERGIEGVPDLIVEIISPPNIFTDRNRKKKVYQQIGVREYWIVDPANHTLEIYRHDQADADTPHLYLVKEGVVSSSILSEVKFDLKEIFTF